MCIRDRYQRRVHGNLLLFVLTINLFDKQNKSLMTLLFSSNKKTKPRQRGEPESSIKYLHSNQQILNKSMNSLYDDMFSSSVLNQSQRRPSFLIQNQQMAQSIILQPKNTALQNWNQQLIKKFSGIDKSIDPSRSFLVHPKISQRKFSQDFTEPKISKFESDWNKRNAMFSSKRRTNSVNFENQDSFRLQQKRLKEDIYAISPAKKLSRLSAQLQLSEPLTKQLLSFNPAIQKSPQRKQNVLNLITPNPISTRAMSMQVPNISFVERNSRLSKDSMIELSQDLQRMTQAQFDQLPTQVKDELRFLAQIIDKKISWSSTFKL
eukprot:TRINITY_DN5221_c0_g1_i4.p1 TRINITY_DN5221_c0_g1~~TRINITY_DN5221_c0_g1_i4.p1  ORF type:complete len:321 (+),score=28.50 TRINITY_DN5221_c0_g1_i4:160-1122(+)